jgi:CheY-like chemotaxis protein
MSGLVGNKSRNTAEFCDDTRWLSAAVRPDHRKSILESAGYEVDVALSGEEALACVTSKPYALILVDVEMPGMDGFTFIERIRAEPALRHIPAILVTSRAALVGKSATSRDHF